MSKREQEQDFFTRFATHASSLLGRPWIFSAALVVLILWAISGPLLGFSDTWQLIINTSTTIITFLMVFIIQNTQNRDSLAVNIKLDTIMEKLGISDDELLEAEDESEKNWRVKRSASKRKATLQRNRRLNVIRKNKTTALTGQTHID
jgi:low affinity Fe/Cu permease